MNGFTGIVNFLNGINGVVNVSLVPMSPWPGDGPCDELTRLPLSPSKISNDSRVKF